MTKQLDLSGVRIYSNTKDDARDAMDLIGEEVYMSDDADFGSYFKGYLVEVKYANGITHPFRGGIEMLIAQYKYLILAKDAKFKENKEEKERKLRLRPFRDIGEFRHTLGCAVGDVITIRRIDKPSEVTCIFNGYRIILEDNKADATNVFLGAMSYTFKELKDRYLYLSGGLWKLFGIEE